MNLPTPVWPIRPWLVAVGILATAVHAPGQLSVDSVVALYEAATGRAFGWTPTFQSALLAWLGGGETASTLHVALMVAVTVLALEALLRVADGGPAWRVALAAAVALNPLVWLMVGVVWRDVLLGIAVLAGTAALLVARRVATTRVPWLPWGIAAVAAAVCVLARQPGFLLAAALVAGLTLQIRGVLAVRRQNAPRTIIPVAAGLLIPLLALATLKFAANSTIKPDPARPAQMSGATLVMLYDIAGMWSHRRTNERLLPVGIPVEIAQRMRTAYSAERIDGLLAAPGLRDWAIAEGRRRMAAHWWAMFRAAPTAYLEHRWNTTIALLGFSDVGRCVPGYWGVAGLPPMLDALGIEERMDPRDRMIGRINAWLSGTPVFWNATYLLALLILVPIAARRFGFFSEEVIVGVAALAYATFFIVAGVACDVRYLFPVVLVVTVLLISVVLNTTPARAAS